ncbi:MAG: DUF192 domain-containing protein [Candidatus Nanohaloarchaea archaeon]
MRSLDRGSLLLLATLVILFSGLLYVLTPGHGDTATVTFYASNTTLATLEVEIADTPRERRVGLMNRTELEGGMLFVFSEEQRLTFWMKNTYVPLDMIFISAGKRVINVEHADPQPNATEEELKRYRSEEPARYVVEVRQGFAENHSIVRGVRVELPE